MNALKFEETQPLARVPLQNTVSHGPAFAFTLGTYSVCIHSIATQTRPQRKPAEVPPMESTPLFSLALALRLLTIATM